MYIGRICFIGLSFLFIVFRSIVSTVSSSGDPLRLRPQSVVVLTDKYIEPESQKNTTSSSNTEISTKLIILLCVFVLARRNV